MENALFSCKGGAILTQGPLSSVPRELSVLRCSLSLWWSSPYCLSWHCSKGCWWHWGHLVPFKQFLHNAFQQILLSEGKKLSAYEWFTLFILFGREQTLAWVLFSGMKYTNHVLPFICGQQRACCDRWLKQNAWPTCCPLCSLSLLSSSDHHLFPSQGYHWH